MAGPINLCHNPGNFQENILVMFKYIRSTFLISYIFLENIFFAADNVNSSLVKDYAFLFLMTMSPDFAAADYTIGDAFDNDTNISIGRFCRCRNFRISSFCIIIQPRKECYICRIQKSQNS